MTSRGFSLLALLLFAPPPEPAPAPSRSDDTVAIVNVLIADRLASRGEAPGGTYVVLVAETLALCPPDEPEEDAFTMTSAVMDPEVLPDVPPTLRRELLCEQSGGMLPSSRYDGAEVVLNDRTADIFSAGVEGWDDFYQRYPESRGLLEVTSPAFSPDREHALVYMSHSCGGLCGTGWLVHLKRSASGWRIESRRMLWIS